MGLLSKIGGAIKNAAIVVGQSIGIIKGTPTVNPNVAKIPIVGTALKTLVEHPFATAAAATVVAAPSKAIAAVKSAIPAVTKVVKTVLPTTKSKVIAAVAAPSAITLLAGSEKARETTVNVGKSIVTGSLGTDVAKTIEGEKPLSETLLAHPVATGVAALGAVAVLGKGLTTAGAIAAGGLLDNDSSPAPTQTGVLVSDKSAEIYKDTPVAAAVTPITPQTQTLASSQNKRRASKKRATPSPLRVSQRVNVVVSQQQNKRYINKVSLYN